jgi:hypothetical protein
MLTCGGFSIYDCLPGCRSSGWTPCCIWAGSTWTSIPTCEFRVTTSVSFGPARVEISQANDRPSAPSVFDRLTSFWDTRSRSGWRLRRIAGDKSWIPRDYAYVQLVGALEKPSPGHSANLLVLRCKLVCGVTPQNGIIVAEPHASFLERWRSSYEDFRPDEWAQHSVARPWVSRGICTAVANMSMPDIDTDNRRPDPIALTGNCTEIPQRAERTGYEGVLLARLVG